MNCFFWIDLPRQRFAINYFSSQKVSGLLFKHSIVCFHRVAIYDWLKTFTSSDANTTKHRRYVGNYLHHGWVALDLVNRQIQRHRENPQP